MVEEKFVMVVEDDPFYSKIYTTKLAKENIRAEIVSTGMEAIKMAKVRRPALILLDLIIPGKDGFETLSELKADPNLKDINVIILSNLSQKDDIKRAMDLGAAEYCVKANIPIHEVIDKVKSYLAA